MPAPGNSIGKAVVLAAGAGIRLGELGTRIPKAMICLGARTILDESIGRLQRAGVREILVVTGHLEEQFAPLAQRHAGLVRLVRNERAEKGGSLSSLACALPLLREDFLLLESDLTYEKRALDVLLAEPAGSLVLVSGETRAGDEVWVERAATGHGLLGISKERRRLGPGVAGELTGICRIAREAIDPLMQYAEEQAAGGRPVDYEDGLVALARLRPVRVLRIDDLRWAEIDTPQMLERVRRDVYPAIAQTDG